MSPPDIERHLHGLLCSIGFTKGMPHSTQGSQSSASTFSLSTSDRPITSGSMASRAGWPSAGSIAIGTARASGGENKWKRNSSPVADAYENLIGSNGNIDEIMHRKAGDRSSMHSTNRDSSRRRTQYYEEQFGDKDSFTGTAKERVQRESPVIAELRTNVIVCPINPDVVINKR